MNALEALLVLAPAAAKGSILLVVAGAVTLLLHRRSASTRHVIWATSMAALLLIIPLSSLMPAWPVHLPISLPSQVRNATHLDPSLAASATEGRGAFPAPSDGSSQAAASLAVPRSAEKVPPRVYVWLLLGWTVGASLLALWFLAGMLRLAHTARASSVIDDERIAELAEFAARELGLSRARFRLRWTSESLTPMTWGLARPFVLLPASSANWADERLRQVLLHELGHIQRRDLLTQAVSCLACVVYWFNPLVWWAARRMLVERERACDDLVLRGGTTPSVYAHELLEIARSLGAGWTTSRIGTAMARKSQVSGRLLAVLDEKRPRNSVRKSFVVAGVFVALGMLLPLCSLAPTPRVVDAPAALVEQTVAFSPAALTGEALDLEGARQQIAETNRGWREALTRRDARRLTAHYTRDAVLVGSNRPPLRGRLEVQTYMEYLLQAGVADVEIQTLELHRVGDMVCEVGRLTTRGASGMEIGNSSFMSLWKKEDGQWRMHRIFVTP